MGRAAFFWALGTRSQYDKMESDKVDQENTVNNVTLLSLLKTDSLGKLSAVFLGIIYLCGLLTLNSHLYKYGVVELGIASTEYLVVGAIFVLYLAVYGLFAGRSIVLSRHWLGQHINQLSKINAPAFSPLIAFVHMFIEMAFFYCLSVALFSTFAFGQIREKKLQFRTQKNLTNPSSRRQKTARLMVSVNRPTNPSLKLEVLWIDSLHKKLFAV